MNILTGFLSLGKFKTTSFVLPDVSALFIWPFSRVKLSVNKFPVETLVTKYEFVSPVLPATMYFLCPNVEQCTAFEVHYNIVEHFNCLSYTISEMLSYTYINLYFFSITLSNIEWLISHRIYDIELYRVRAVILH